MYFYILILLLPALIPWLEYFIFVVMTAIFLSNLFFFSFTFPPSIFFSMFKIIAFHFTKMLPVYHQSTVWLLLFNQLDSNLLLIKCLKHTNTHMTLRQSVYCWTRVSGVNYGGVMIVIGSFSAHYPILCLMQQVVIRREDWWLVFLWLMDDRQR